MNWTRTVPWADCKHILKKKLELQVGFVAPPSKTEKTEIQKLTLAQPTGRMFRK
jgi:hypothetical protein